MRHITKFLLGCLLAIFYTILFVFAFTYNSILFLPFASIIIIIAIVLGMFCTPLAIILVIIWIVSMIARSVLDVWDYAKNLVKS